jgi:hypothetical protein
VHAAVTFPPFEETMPNRPAIPADVKRAVLIESGYRCAVCGEPRPLERAHIIPWHKTKSHKAEDLICLCSSCHERADIEKWGEKALRQIKATPWILRQRNNVVPFSDKRAVPQLVRWSPNRGGVAGIDILTEPSMFVSWDVLKDQILNALIPQVQNLGVDSSVRLKKFRGRKNWIVAVSDVERKEVANIWFGTNPTNHWAHDGLVRIGPVKKEATGQVWQTFQRYSDGTYLRIHVDSEVHGSSNIALRKMERTTPPVSKLLEQNLAALKVSTKVRKSLRAVISHPAYPLRMSISGTLVNNPVWQTVPTAFRRKIVNQYLLGGPSPPQIMRLDIFLIRSTDSHGRGNLFTYYSPDWGAYLFPFRQWLRDDDIQSRHQLNAIHLSHHWNVPAKYIEVHELHDKYAVSAKLHAKHRDLIIYVFEFCSVKFKKLPEPECLQGNLPQPHNANAWFDLRELRGDAKAWTVNGDLIRALHTLFSVNLRSLPDSLPAGFTQK